MAVEKREKLQIIPEKEGGRLQFDESNPLEALFNPKLLSFSRSVGWKMQGAAQRDSPELQFTNAEPQTLSLDLFFDTYDTPIAEKSDVREKYLKRLLHLTTVETHGDKHRPPVCRLRWGRPKYFFQGVLEKLDQKFTMFLEDGTPVRATATCTFKEWRTNYDRLNLQDTQSADLAKRWIVKRGDSLSGIAAMEYLDPCLWRPIAAANNIDNPFDLRPGHSLIIPALPLNTSSRKQT
jgi:hypothetical protein